MVAATEQNTKTIGRLILAVAILFLLGFSMILIARPVHDDAQEGITVSTIATTTTDVVSQGGVYDVAPTIFLMLQMIAVIIVIMLVFR